MAYNAAERKDVRKAEKEAKVAEDQRKQTIKQIMETLSGRRWMLERLEECHVFRTSFNRDICTMAFMEGQRDIGLRFLNDIMSSCPDEYLLMMRESNERRSTSERTDESDPNWGDQGSEPDTSDADSGNGEAPGDSRFVRYDVT